MLKHSPPFENALCVLTLHDVHDAYENTIWFEYAREKKPWGITARLSYLPFVPEQILALPHATHPACALGYMLNANIYYQSN